ncbi:MAG: hypothetical protein R2685_13015 [Candidatus Nitrosocosmicus sp.]|nr:hypothetical protein [Candidatus Nitrosocosmicus sp.]
MLISLLVLITLLSVLTIIIIEYGQKNPMVTTMRALMFNIVHKNLTARLEKITTTLVIILA